VNHTIPVSKSQRLQRAALIGLAALLAVNALVVGVTYLFYPGYWDHGEPVVAAASFKMLSGQQVYPDFGSAQFTSNLYGPLLFGLNGLMMAMFGANVAASKLLGVVAIAVTLMLSWASHRRFGIVWTAVAVMLTAAYALINLPYALWNRPDPALMMVAAVAVFQATRDTARTNWLWASFVLGVLGGIACGLKLYGFVYIAPVGIYLALILAGWRGVAVMTATGIGVAGLPFALPVFNLASYIDWFGLMAGKTTAAEMLTKGLRYSVLTALGPLWLLIAASRTPASPARLAELAYAGFTLLGIAACTYLASKPGAGFYYVLPFAPLAVHQLILSAQHAKPKPVAAAVLACVLVLVMAVPSIAVQKRFFRALDWTHATSVTADIENVIRRYPRATIEMGTGISGNGYRDTLYKPLLLFAGHPYSVDFGIMMETSYLGIALPNPLVQSVEDCRTEIWLIPKGETPFAMLGYYGNPSVDPAYRRAFETHYRLVDSSAFFDVWRCSR